MNQYKRISDALEELEQVRTNIQKKASAFRTLHQEALASDIIDWSVIIHSVICEIRDAQDKAIDDSLKNANEQNAALLQGILGGSIVQPGAKP